MSKLMIEDTAITCADRVDVTAMKVMMRIPAAPPLPAMVMAKYGSTKPPDISVDVMRYLRLDIF